MKTAAPVALHVAGLRSPPLVRDVSFAVHEGEILGLGGLVGAGRSETVEAIFGLRRAVPAPSPWAAKSSNPKKPAQAVRAGIGFVAEDRRSQNIVPDLSVKENLLLAHLGAHRGFGLGYRSREKDIDRLLASLGLPADRLLDANMLELLRRDAAEDHHRPLAAAQPKVLILDEPTKGVDIGTRQSIYQLLRDVAARASRSWWCPPTSRSSRPVRPHRRNQRRRPASPTCRLPCWTRRS